MGKKIIQVPMDDVLLSDIDRWCERRELPRARFIRESCREYLKKVEEEESDRAYQKGYELHPEEPAAAAAQMKLVKKIAPGEKW